MTLGVTDGLKNAGWVYSSIGGKYHNTQQQTNYGSVVGSPIGTDGLTVDRSLGITTDSTKSGIESEISSIVNYAIKY